MRVFNSCELDGQEITIEGTATAVNEDLGYGEDGVFRVQFPGQPEPECPGPNYIVQGMTLRLFEQCFVVEHTRC